MIVMVEEQTGEKYARAVGVKGMKSQQDENMDWLVKDMSKELRAWGHGGGVGGSFGVFNLENLRNHLMKFFIFLRIITWVTMIMLRV